jgi:polysaccharide biosynthesis/export protein
MMTGQNMLKSFFALLLAFFSFGAMAQAGDSKADYVLGPGDVIRITVFQSPDLSLETRISEGGVITYPLLGSVSVGGVSVSGAEKRIADGLKRGNFLKQPQVSILLMQVRSNQASILGQIVRPGRYPLETTSTKFSELLATAGGVVSGGADQATLVGQRNGKQVRIDIDIPGTLTGAPKTEDLIILNGDVIYVDRSPTIYMYGEVQRPGVMRLERNMTVLQALAAAGGITQRGTEKGLRVHRRGADGKLQVVQPAMDEMLKDGDVVYLRESLF